MLISLIVIPILGVISLLIMQKCSLRVIRRTAISVLTLPIFIIFKLLYEIAHSNSLEQYGISLNQTSWLSNQPIGLAIKLLLGIDAVSLWLMLVVTIIVILAAFAGVYVKKRQKLFYGLVLLLHSALLMLFMARDVVLLISAYAILAMIMMFLIGIWGQDGSRKAARQYGTWQLVACALLIISALLLLAMQMGGEHQLSLSDEASYTMQEQILDEQPEQQQLRIAALLLFVVAMLCITPVIGLHQWFKQLFLNAHMAVLMIYCGAMATISWYMLYRVGNIYFFDLLGSISEGLIWLYVIQLFLASMMLWRVKHLRGWLAYGAWGQLSLIGIVMLTLTEQGLTISIVHIFSFIVISALLCFLLAAIIERTGTDHIDSLSGIFKKVPFLGGSFVFATLAWLGIPGLSHFLGIYHAALLTFPINRWITGMIMISVICSVLATIKILFIMQRGQAESRYDHMKDMRFTEAIPNIILLSIIILLGCYPVIIVDMLEVELHTIFALWKHIITGFHWDSLLLVWNWSLEYQLRDIIVVFALTMMLGIGVISRKQTQLRNIISWQALFQLAALTVVIATQSAQANNINWPDLVQYALVYGLLVLGTYFGIKIGSKEQQATPISAWNGMYYRDPKLAFLLVLLILNWMALPFTSAFQVKLSALSEWVNSGQYDILTIWILLHLLMLKPWFEWVGAMYMVSKSEQLQHHQIEKIHNKDEGTIKLLLRTRFTIVLSCVIILLLIVLL